jgi:hypothetical protein
VTTLIPQAVSTREAADPALQAWRFLWVPLADRPAAVPQMAAAPLPPAPVLSATATALAVVEAVPERFAQAALPAVVAAYRQNTD